MLQMGLKNKCIHRDIYKNVPWNDLDTEASDKILNKFQKITLMTELCLNGEYILTLVCSFSSYVHRYHKIMIIT